VLALYFFEQAIACSKKIKKGSNVNDLSIHSKPLRGLKNSTSKKELTT
jgi:hypothetical protein